MAKGKVVKTEKELQADIQEALRHLTDHSLRLATIANSRTMLPPTTSESIQSLGRDLGVIAKHLQAAREWEVQLVDTWNMLHAGAR